MSQKIIIPFYTLVAEEPKIICKLTDIDAFNFPFLNEGLVRANIGEKGNREIFSIGDVTLPREDERLIMKGFIFHTSHCGSTLLARMLGSSERVRVVSETESINGLLISYKLYNLPADDVLMQLKAIIETFRQPGNHEQWLIFKLSSWNVFFIHLFQQLYPDVGWLFLDRDTEEVVHSLLKNGGGFADWWHHPVGALRNHFLGLEQSFPNMDSYLETMVKLHRFHAEKNLNGKGRLLYYPGFIQLFESIILPHFSLAFTSKELEQAREMEKYESKIMEPVLFSNHLNR